MFNQFSTNFNKRDITTIHYAMVKSRNHESGGRQKLWALATDGRNNILAESGNYYKFSHPLQSQFALQCGCEHLCNTLHAEIGVIAQLRRTNKKASKLFIARANAWLHPMLAKPCKVCQLAIKDQEFKKIFWTEPSLEIDL